MELDIEYDFSLIAINTIANDVQIAYYLNRHLNTRFTRIENDLDVYYKGKNQAVLFPLYLHEDTQYMESWYLINNKFTSEDNISVAKEDKNSLFFDSEFISQSNTYFLPEKKEVNFILRLDYIENDNRIEQIVKEIRSIPIITTAYPINYNTLRSKKNLIF